MARSRNIKPGFYANEDLAECDIWARFIFPGLWMMADREGRLEYRPKKIKGELLRFDNQPVEPLLEQLAARGFIAVYGHGEKRYIQILQFHKHQNPHHREAPSAIPSPEDVAFNIDSMTPQPEAVHALQPTQAPDEPEESPGKAQGEPEALPPCEGGTAVLIPDSGFLIPDSIEKLSADAEKRAPKKSRTDTDPDFEEAWKACPKREGPNSKQDALKAWRARIREGEEPARLIAAAKAYAVAMTQEGSVGTRFVKQAARFFGPSRHYADYAPRRDDDGQGDLVPSGAPEADAPWWVRAGFAKEWEATNAGVTEKYAHLWRDGRPLVKVYGANVEPWPEGTYERT
ncbi:hypothetical protein [Burkholderia gladioli]|uniref:hypothetical protein n=1 Tax=Burkholderia gladioli TaxID=28095 RepID=UPI0034DB51CB